MLYFFSNFPSISTFLRSSTSLSVNLSDILRFDSWSDPKNWSEIFSASGTTSSAVSIFDIFQNSKVSRTLQIILICFEKIFRRFFQIFRTENREKMSSLVLFHYSYSSSLKWPISAQYFQQINFIKKRKVQIISQWKNAREKKWNFF